MSELIACHHKVTLDIAKRDVCTIEVVNQDTANILEVNVCENGKEVSLENATLVTITYSNDTVDEMQISEDFKTAFIRINANCLKQGINFAKVCIYSGDNGLITAEMLTINCKQTVGSDNPSVPDPDMPKLKEMIEELVKQSASSEQIAAAVSQYLKDNPITETDPTVPDWAKEKNKPTYTAAEVGALSEGTLDTAINEALAAAKASGEFDGEGGITPTIGDNGNWFLGDTDTGKPSRGNDGKSAYSYAQDGGYTGTEAEFAAKLAEETGTVPENVALLENVTVDEASGDFIPMLSPNGTEYRLSIGDNGVPVIKNANGATVWSGTSGGSSGGDTGGDDPGGGGTDTTWTSGVPYTLTIIANEYVNETSGAFKTYAGWSRTDYTPCAGAARIVHTGNRRASIYCVWYDINKNFISNFTISTSPEEIEVPADAAFFVMSNESNYLNAMTVTPYGT